MRKEVEQMEDGRYIIYYGLDEEDGALGDADEARKPAVEGTESR